MRRLIKINFQFSKYFHYKHHFSRFNSHKCTRIEVNFFFSHTNLPRNLNTQKSLSSWIFQKKSLISRRKKYKHTEKKKAKHFTILSKCQEEVEHRNKKWIQQLWQRRIHVVIFNERDGMKSRVKKIYWKKIIQYSYHRREEKKSKTKIIIHTKEVGR